MKKQLRIIVCLMLCTSIFLSFCLVEHNTSHNCIGEDCQLCRDIALQRELMKSVLLTLMCGTIVASVAQLSVFLSSLKDMARGKINLVANKIKITA